MKKVLIIITLSLVMTLSFVACGTKEDKAPPETPPATVSESDKETVDKEEYTQQDVQEEVPTETDRILSGTYIEVAREKEGLDPEWVEQDIKEHPSMYVFNEDGTVEDHHWDRDNSSPTFDPYERIDMDDYCIKDDTLYITKYRNGTWTEKATLSEDDNTFIVRHAGYTVTYEKQ